MVIPQNMIQQAMTHSHIIIIIYIYMYIHILFDLMLSHIYIVLYIQPLSFFSCFPFQQPNPEQSWRTLLQSMIKPQCWRSWLPKQGSDPQSGHRRKPKWIYIYIYIYIYVHYICALNIIYMYTMWIIMDNWDSKSATTRIQSEHSWIYSPVITRVLL